MSRIGIKPINMPTSVELKVDGELISVKGPKGTLSENIKSCITIEVKEGEIIVNRSDDKYKALHGLSRTLIANMVEGVTNGYSKKLEINGVGYRAAKQGNKLALTLGFSHPVEFFDNEDIQFEVEGQNVIIVKGISKQKVGQMASNVREKRPPEPYKGKGIKYAGERIIRKEGKAGGKK